MKAKLLNTIVRAGGNPVLPAKETVTLDALAPVFPFCTGVRYPKYGNLWTEVNGERRIRKSCTENAERYFNTRYRG